MKRWFILFGAAALVLALAGGCDKTDKTTGPDGADNAGPNAADSLVIARDFPPLLANGLDQITVRATVVDALGRGLQNIGVHFATNHGSVPPFATTNSSGVAEVALTSAASVPDVSASVTAWASQDSAGAKPAPKANVLVSRLPLSESMILCALDNAATAEESAKGARGEGIVYDVALVPMLGITLSVAANPRTVPADGITPSQVTARLMETTRRVPLRDEEIRFGVSTGAITGRVTTDPSGAATASLTGLESGALSEVTVYYGNTLTAATSVTFSALSLSLEPQSPAITADGFSSTRVVARLMNTENNPVAGARIDFSTTLGSVTASATTDELGIATATLVAGDATGTASVTARFGADLSASAQVTFAAIPATSTLLLSADPAEMPADGASRSVLLATALDANGFPVPDGTAVLFVLESGSGQIVAPLAATSSGQAQATFIAGTTAGPVTVRAESGTTEVVTSIALASLGTSNIILTSSPASILADGIAYTTITAVLTDGFGNPVVPGTAVQFATSRGVLEELTPTDATGTATAKLRASRFETGLARVTATAGEATKTIDVTFTSEAAAHIEAMGVDHPSIGVLGASDHETATIFFEVQDRNGIPVDAAHAVTLSYVIVPTSGNPDATVYPPTAVTNQNGQAAATVNAGIISGAVEVKASSGSMLSQPIRVAIHGDLPDEVHFSFSVAKLNIAGLVFDGIRDAVTARVGDAHGNPVPDSTAVWYSCAYGLVQGSAFTDDHAEATVDHITGAPRPAIPGGDGLVEICVQTVDKSGQRIVKCGNVMWSGPAIVEFTDPETFDVPNGGSVTLTYRVRDANENPLTSGTTIAVSSTAGTLGGDVEFTMPDTQSQSYTTFQVILSDSDTEQDRAEAATVTVSVRSQNGNRNASITGVIH
jgi:hypothetical protein